MFSTKSPARQGSTAARLVMVWELISADINNDGYPDIYISNDFHENDYLYINNGNGTFTEQLHLNLYAYKPILNG